MNSYTLLLSLFNENKMKTTATSLFVIFFFSLGISQDLSFEIRGKYTRGVSLEKLSVAETMIDIRPGYPSSWIEGYTSTQVSVTTKGKVRSATGINDTLSAEQQNLLQMADVGSDIVVDIGYIHQNPVTLFPDIRNINFAMTVVPEVEATFPEGYQALISYLEQNAMDKISEDFTKEMRTVVINFTVTKAGEIANVRVSKSSDDPEIDKLLLRVINKMPQWNPAEDDEGRKIEQEFEFIVGNIGC